MLFNPRTQSTSYTMTASIAALLAATCLLEGRTRAALALAAVVFGWTVNHNDFPFIEFWLKPLVCIAFGAMLVRGVFAPPEGWQTSRTPVPDSA
jgi:glucose dehydrogenase